MANTLYIVVYPAALGAPSAAQIVAGQDSTGSAASWAGNAAWSGAGQYLEASGLSASTSYKSAAVVYDGSGYSNVVASGAWSTTAVDTPSAAAAGNIVVTGSAAGGVRSLKSNAALGSVTVLGSVANGIHAIKSAAATGNIAITGSAASGAKSSASDTPSAAAAGSINIVGSATVGTWAHLSAADASSITIVGSAATGAKSGFLSLTQADINAIATAVLALMQTSVLDVNVVTVRGHGVPSGISTLL